MKSFRQIATVALIAVGTIAQTATAIEISQTDVTVPADGTATFTISLPGNNNYMYCQLTFDITVQSGGVTVSPSSGSITTTDNNNENRSQTFTVTPTGSGGSGTITITFRARPRSNTPGTCNAQGAPTINYEVSGGSGPGPGPGPGPGVTPPPENAIPFSCNHFSGWYTPFPEYIPSGQCGPIQMGGMTNPSSEPSEPDIITLFGTGSGTGGGTATYYPRDPIRIDGSMNPFGGDVLICPEDVQRQLNIQIPVQLVNDGVVLETCNGPGGETTTSPPGKNKTVNTQSNADPVSMATGELHDNKFVSPDLFLGGILPLHFSRFYSSFLRANGFMGTLGENWTHNFDFSIERTGQFATVRLFGGKDILFRETDNGWVLSSPTKLDHQLRDDPSGGWQYLDLSTELIYTFDADGRLTGITTRNGNGWTITPSEEAPGPAMVEDGLGRSLTFTYREGKMRTVTDQGGRTVTYRYSGERLRAVTDANGGETTFAYTVQNYPGLLTLITYPDGSTLSQSYAAEGQVRQQIDSEGRMTSFQFGAGQSAATDSLGRTSTTQHMGFANVAALTDAAGGTESFSYDANDRVVGYTDAEGNQAAFGYHDPSGYFASINTLDGEQYGVTYEEQVQDGFRYYLPSGTQSPNGVTRSFEYDARGNMTRYVDRSGNEWRMTYNARGQLFSVTNPLGGRTFYSYDAGDGTMTAIRRDGGRMITIEHDGLKRVSKITYADGSERSYEYDAYGNLTTVTDEAGNTETATYDERFRLVSLTDPLGNTRRLVHDSLGRTTSVTDRRGGVHTYTYDAAAQLANFTNAAGDSVDFTYDDRGLPTRASDAIGTLVEWNYDNAQRLVSFADGLGQTTSFTLNEDDQPSVVTLPGGGIYRYTYRGDGLVTAIEDPAGGVTNYALDASGRHSGIETGGVSVGYERGPFGDITAIVDANGGRWTRDYDREARLAGQTDPLGRSSTVAYDTKSRVATVTTPEGTVTYEFSPVDALLRRTYSDGTVIEFGHDAAKRMTTGTNVTLGYDAEDDITESNGLAIERDAVGRILSVTYSPGKTVRYEYDERGRLIKVTDWNGGETSLSYDAADQLTAINRPNGVTTTLTRNPNREVTGIRHANGTVLAEVTAQRDATGRIVSLNRNIPTISEQAAGTLPLSFDAAHQVEGSTYDGEGRLTADAFRNYTWNGPSTLTSYQGQDGAAQFTYDAFNNRVSRSANGATTNYVWNYGLGLPSVAVERDGDADAAYYVHLPNGILLYAIDAADNARSFYHFDIGGNTVALTNDAGQVTDSYDAGPFGEAVTHDGPSDQPFVYHGAYGAMWESGTSLYYFRMRYYDAATARFISPDPLMSMDPLQINRYQFAVNDPINHSDPTGLAAATTPGSTTTMPVVESSFPFPHLGHTILLGGKILIDKITDFRLQDILTQQRSLGDHMRAIVQGFNGNYDRLMHVITNGATEAAKNFDLNKTLESLDDLIDPRHRWWQQATETATELADDAAKVSKYGKAFSGFLGGAGVALDTGLVVYDGVKHDDHAGLIAFDATTTALADVATLHPVLAIPDAVTLGGVSGSLKNAVTAPVDITRVVTDDRLTSGEQIRIKQRWTRAPPLAAVWWLGEKIGSAIFD